MRQLIKQGAEVDWRGWDDRTALHAAAESGQSRVIAHLLDSGWSLEARTVSGRTPLSRAADAGHLHTAMCLLLLGAQIDSQDDYMETPLHYASQYGNIDLVQLLLQCGANQEIRNDEGITAEDVAKNDLTRAMFSEYKEKKKQSQIGLLQQAIDDKNYDVAIIFLFRGVTLEGSDNLEKLIQIIKDVKKEDDNFVRALVSHGTELSGISYRNLLALFNVASIRENIENHLIQNVEVTDDSGDTPLHAVAATNNEKLLKLLLNNGASSTQFLQNKRGQIPLEISKNNKYMFRIILIDFLNYALKSPKFSSDEFQNQLGSGYNLFCLKRDFEGNKTLLEFSS